MKKYIFLILSIFFFLPSYTYAARLATIGFELATTTSAVEFTDSGATISITTSTPRSGTYAGRVNASNGFFRQVVFTSNQTTTGSNCSGVRIVSPVNANTQLIRWNTTGNVSVGNITLTPSSTLVLLQSGGGQIGSASSVLNTGQWYFICLKNNASASPGTLTASVDGTQFASGLNSNRGAWARALIGTITGTQTTSDILFDDWKINDSSGSNETAEAGLGSLVMLRPNAVGDANAWTRGGADSGANWSQTDEITPNDATDYVLSTTLNNSDFYNLEDTTLIGNAGTVAVVQYGVRFANDTADATVGFKLQAKKTTGGTVASSTQIIPNSTTWRTHTTAAPDVYALTLYNDPDGTAWTQTTINSMQAGTLLTADGTNNVEISTIWAYVEYTFANVATTARRKLTPIILL